jgi:hypothetical protein
MVDLAGLTPDDLQCWGLLRSSPGTGAAIVVPLGLTLLTGAFPASWRGSALAGHVTEFAKILAGRHGEQLDTGSPPSMSPT